MSRLQVLVATMHQQDFSKVEEMGIESDVIFANQNDCSRYEEKIYSDFSAKMITTNTRGVGMNRNIALEYADADLVLIADDDMKYVSGYKKIVINAFEEVPDADALIFNIDTIGMDMKRRQNSKIQRIHIWNAFNYGAARIAVKRKCLEDNHIVFNLNFGGGTIYSSGEDTLFIGNMLKRKLKIYSYPVTIAAVDQTSSTWFSCYNRKYFYDKGALFAALSKHFALFLSLQDIIRHRDIYTELSFHDMVLESIRGMKGYKRLLPYKCVKE